MYKIVLTDYFKKQLKKLVKRNPKLKENFKKSLQNFQKEKAISIGMGVYKIRIQGKGRGKSGGYRVYVFLIEIKKILTPVCIYSKGSKENLKINELVSHLEKIKSELEKLL